MTHANKQLQHHQISKTKSNWIYQVVSKKRDCEATSDDGKQCNTSMQSMAQDILDTENTYLPNVSEYFKTNIMNLVYSSGVHKCTPSYMPVITVISTNY